jgi:ribosomal RNA assembly protein
MQEIYVENIKELILNKEKIEKKLNLKIEIKGKLVFINGKGEDEYIGIKIMEAINLGFSCNKALKLLDENYILQSFNIKDLTRRKDYDHIKGRLIGVNGKVLANLRHLTDCEISVRNRSIGIIGDVESINEAIIAIKSLVQGTKHGNVYARLEKEKKKRRLKF